MAVQIIGRKIEVSPSDVCVAKANGNYAYPRKVDALQTGAQIDGSQYALIREGNEADVAISIAQRFNGKNLKFHQMAEESRKTGEILATPRWFMRNLQDVNSAIRGEGVIYDAQGNLIEGTRLVQYAQTLNHNCWVYLNGRFPKGRGFKGLDFVTVNADGTLTRAPLEDCLEQDGYAELESLNNQGLLTKKAKNQSYEPGKTVYFYSPVLRQENPDEGYVARVNAYSDRAYLYCLGRPDCAASSLGGLVCAEGTVAQKIQENK